MLESLTVDQLRLFLTVAEEGSFSAAGRRLGRVQSVVSYGIANLEEALGVELFVRSGRRTKLTPAGKAIVEDARRVLAQLGQLRAHAANLVGSVEPAVSLVVDTIFPNEILTRVCRAFQAEFPAVSLRLHTESLNTVVALVLDGTCQLGIGGPVGPDEAELDRQFLAHVTLVPVVAPDHALARLDSPIPTDALRQFVQIVITERNRESAGPDHTVLSAATWSVVGAPTKLEFIRAGLGWGNLPLDLVREDVASGRLTQLELAEWGGAPIRVPFYSLARIDTPLGVAASWLSRRFEIVCHESVPRLVVAVSKPAA